MTAVAEPAPAPIQIDDPLLIHFTIQHDLRARFQTAIDDALDCLRHIDDPEVACQYAKGILAQAVDEESVMEWMKAGRPLPFIDQKVGPQAEALTQAVLDMMKQIEESRNDHPE